MSEGNVSLQIAIEGIRRQARNDALEEAEQALLAAAARADADRSGQAGGYRAATVIIRSLKSKD